MGEWPPQYADARTLEGKLQRGLGAGFLGALDAPREIAHAALMGCITVDPRWDHQIDDREWYYGELAFRTELPVGPIEAALREWGNEDEDGDSWIALDVLGHLAERGNDDASAVLRDYVTWGPWWDSALCGLRSAGEPDWRSLVPSLLRKARDESTGSYFLVRPPFSIWAESMIALGQWSKTPGVGTPPTTWTANRGKTSKPKNCSSRTRGGTTRLSSRSWPGVPLQTTRRLSMQRSTLHLHIREPWQRWH